MSGSTLPFVTKASSKVLSKAIKATSSSFQLAYFNFHGRAESTRYLLAYTRVPWKEIVFFSEVLPIERYLADKFELAGSDPWERFQVEQFVSSIESSQLMYHYKVILPNWPSEGAVDMNEDGMKRQRRAEDASRFYETGLKNFVDVHEKKLQENGGGENGHYVGDKTSLADIRATVLMDRLMLLRPEGADPVPLSKDKTPNLWRVREAVHQILAIAQWRESKRYQDLDALTKKYFCV
ncbi:hypothetical protein BGX30_011084 [Mortierella sp. GBA39]|nr:hypothetical protein BGX30_011084 [Mortierella sp. GBA39]